MTGMRRRELLGLQWEQSRNGFIYHTETKSGQARQIPINDRLQGVFRELRQKAIQELLPPQTHEIKSEYGFCDSQRRRFSGVKRSVISACKRAETEACRFHDLGQTFAVRLVMRGDSLKAVQELLGHASLAMTMRYARLFHEHLRDFGKSPQ